MPHPIAGKTVIKKVLDNGLTILLVPRHDVPKVSFQMWYNVGAKDEAVGFWNGHEWINQRGLAHFIEHMIFKGTAKLTESDINTLVYRLSGSCNAFTSQDYTGYLFDVPSQNWRAILPVMADCMQNCTFKQEFINSELKAVVQEIKMYNDDYVSTLIEKMAGAIFQDHPYHRPVIGYKQDLWNMTQAHLLDFYRQHYGPNNATLLVVGDIDPDVVYEQIKHDFAHIKPLENYSKKEFFYTWDLEAHDVTIAREIKQPILLLSWVIPGSREKKEYLFDLMSWILGAGKGACLYNKLVNELSLATEVQSFVYDLFDYGLFYIYVQPNKLEDIAAIKTVILAEIEHYRKNHVTNKELQRAQRKTEMDFLNLGEDNQKLAYLLGKTYLATGDEQYLFNYCNYPHKNLKQDIQDLFQRYFMPSMMHTGEIVPLHAEDQPVWLEIQQQSDDQDAAILGTITREELLEDAQYAKQVAIEKPVHFNFPKPQKLILSNGLTVLYYNRPGVGKIDLIIDLKAKHFYDAPHKQGLSMMLADMLQEGTKKHSALELAYELESYGMELNTFPGQIGMTMLSHDAKKGLNVLYEVLTECTFKHQAIERIRTQMLAELTMFWDDPQQFAGQLIREIVYQEHPYGRNILGTEKDIKTLTQEDLFAAYHEYITPYEARLAIIGDLADYDIKELLESTLGSWQGPAVRDIDYPAIQPVKHAMTPYPINRDQTVLCYGGLSVNRFNPDYDKLLLFDQVFTGGVLGGMNSRLFQIREQSGLFYSIGGSLLAGVNTQPGMIFIKTLLSNDRLAEGKKLIEGVISEGACALTQEELEEAQRALINSMVDNFENNRQMAATFIVMDKYKFPENYFDIRPAQLYAITVEDIKDAVTRYLDTDKLATVQVGRVRK